MYITMSDIRREILEELTRVRLDKTRLYTLLLKIVDSCECCTKTSAPAPAPVAAPVSAPAPVPPPRKAVSLEALNAPTAPQRPGRAAGASPHDAWDKLVDGRNKKLTESEELLVDTTREPGSEVMI